MLNAHTSEDIIIKEIISSQGQTEITSGIKGLKTAMELIFTGDKACRYVSDASLVLERCFSG